nr:unnamed protein product [Callosobruchus analis]
MIKQRQKNRFYDASYKRLQNNLSGTENAIDSGDEETELFVRKKTQKRETHAVEKLIQEGDTLQSLAIRYHCTIEDLKRLNNIHKENEIFARPTIRVPQRPFGISLAGVHSSGTTSPTDGMPSNAKIVDITSLNNKLKDSMYCIFCLKYTVSFLNKTTTRKCLMGRENVKHNICTLLSVAEI